jgi:phage-related minor tail protein
MADISDGLAGMTEQQRNLTIQQLAGTYGMKALSSIIGAGANSIEDMAMTMESAATAQEVGAERTRGFAAAMEQLQGAIQTFMITAGTPLIQNVITPLIQKIGEVIGRLIELDPKLIGIGLAIAGVAAAIGPVLLILGGLATVIGALASPIGLVLVAVAALGAAFVAANGGIGPTIENLKGIGSAIMDFVQPILDGLASFWAWLWPYLSQLFKDIWRDLAAFFGPLIQEMAALFEGTFGRIKAWVYENMPLIKQTIVTILEAIQAIWDRVWPYMASALMAVWEVIKGVVRTATTMILGILKAVMLAINGDWEGAWEEIKKTLESAWLIMTGALANALQAVKDTFGKWVAAGVDLIGGFIQGVRNKAGELIRAVTGAVSNAIDAAKRLLGIGSPSKLFEDIGINTMKGFAQGIEATRNVPAVAAQNAAGGVMRSATVTYNSAPIINSQAAMLQLLALTRAQSITQTAMRAV